MQNAQQPYHLPVMLAESLEGLCIKPDGVYADVTFGGGGHARAILAKLRGGKLFAFDQDAQARQNAEQLQQDIENTQSAENQDNAGNSFAFIETNFRYLKKYLRLRGCSQLDGILADLGVSSYHLDAAERGFSIRTEAKLDMRMDTAASLSAFDVVNDYDFSRLRAVFSAYGELRRTSVLAKAVLAARALAPIRTTQALRKAVEHFAPPGKENKFLAQVFQAIRIEVNDELGALRCLLEDAPKLLKPGGRLVVLSYHSLEDRLVKHFMKTGNFEGVPQKDFYGNLLRPLKPLKSKVTKASEAEVAQNNRARSARLRVAERTDF